MKFKLLFLTLTLLLVVGVVAVTAQDKSGCSSCSTVKTASLTPANEDCSCGECTTCKAAMEQTEKRSCNCGDCASCKTRVETAGTQTSCPVSDEGINKEFYSDHDGKRVYFCCAGCVKAFNDDPHKYLKKLKNDGVKLEILPKTDDLKKT